MKDVRAWYERLVKLGEEDYPFIEHEGVMYTPRQIFMHAQANDAIWVALQPSIDPEVTWELLKKRILKRYAEGKLLPWRCLGRRWTPEEIVEEVKKGSAAGQEFMLMEKKFIEEMSK